LAALFQAKEGDWFILATNLAPCVGVRVHLWPDIAKSGGLLDFEEAVEVTMKMAEIPTGPTPLQVYPLLIFFLSFEMAVIWTKWLCVEVVIGDAFLH